MQLGVVFYPGKADNCRTILPMAKQIKMRINISINIHLETFLLALKLMDKLDNVHMKLMMIDSGCTTVNI